MKPVGFSALAEADLEAIADFIAEDNPQRAATFVEELRSRCEKISRFPQAAPPFPKLAADAGVVSHKRYIILFRDLPDRIWIVRILHGARDIMALMDETRQQERDRR